MSEWLSLLALVFAVSLDGLAAGMTYGVRRIEIPPLSVAVIAVCSGVMMFLSMTMGSGLLHWISPLIAERLGAVILIFIGGWALYNLSRDKSERGKKYRSKRLDETSEKKVIFELKTFGLVIQILKKPVKADVDRSGSISAKEAVLLGAALSLDAFGAGIGAALIGLTPWATSLSVAAMSVCFLIAGVKMGFRYAALPRIKPFIYLPGLLLILTGIVKML